MTLDEMKKAAAQAALAYVPDGEPIGVGTGSTVNHFIDALARRRERLGPCVSSSEASTARLRALGLRVVDAGEAEELAVYVDGADEIDPRGHMVKGGGAALTREKIVAAQSKRFVCIADAGKNVPMLGAFPLPVEIIPMARAQLARRFASKGGEATLRMKDGVPLVTDNGQHLLDVGGLAIGDPVAFEMEVSQWPGVVTVGVFAKQRAHVGLFGGPDGVETVNY